MPMKNLNDVLEHEIKDLFSAEKQILEALPKVIKASSDSELVSTLQRHFEETKVHVDRLERIIDSLGIKNASNLVCKGMEGLLKEGEELIKEKGDKTALDAALLSAAQRVEHYEIAAYGSARAHAQALGLNNVVTLLQSTLDEEGRADDLLNDVALGRGKSSGVNVRALPNEKK